MRWTVLDTYTEVFTSRMLVAEGICKVSAGTDLELWDVLRIVSSVGKAGAAVGTQVFTPIQNHLGKR